MPPWRLRDQGWSRSRLAWAQVVAFSLPCLLCLLSASTAPACSTASPRRTATTDPRDGNRPCESSMEAPSFALLPFSYHCEPDPAPVKEGSDGELCYLSPHDLPLDARRADVETARVAAVAADL